MMLRNLVFAGTLAALIPASALAARPGGVSGVGPRIGFSVSPDQLVLGGHLVVGEVAPRMAFVPNLELGVGDDRTLIAMNFDMHYTFMLRDSDWRPYAGAGLGINFEEIDREPPRDDTSETNVGGNVIIGAAAPTRSGNQFFGELRFGLGDIPSLKLVAGWTFGM